MIRAVCFDCDGLMFNTEHVFYDAGQELFARRGIEMNSEIMNLMLGRRPQESFQRVVDHLQLDETAEQLLAESRIIFEAYLETRLETMTGLLELITAINERQLPVGVATSSPRHYLNNILSRFALADVFRITLTAEDVEHGKPHPEIYLRAAAGLGVEPAEMLVLEDTETGCRAGVSAGAHVVAVPHEHTADHDFTGVQRIVSSLADPYLRQLISEC